MIDSNECIVTIEYLHHEFQGKKVYLDMHKSNVIKVTH